MIEQMRSTGNIIKRKRIGESEEEQARAWDEVLWDAVYCDALKAVETGKEPDADLNINYIENKRKLAALMGNIEEFYRLTILSADLALKYQVPSSYKTRTSAKTIGDGVGEVYVSNERI